MHLPLRPTLTGVLLAMLSSLWAVTAEAQTYVIPTTPFNGPLVAPLTTSLNTQHKSGSLGVGTSSAHATLCLNSTASFGDAANCISSWSDLAGLFSGPFINLSTDTFNPAAASISCGPSVLKVNCPTDYTLQTGFANLQAIGKQAFSTIVRAPNHLNGFVTTAVYATDRGNSQNTAAYFSGLTLIARPLNTSETAFGRLCLNGTPEGIGQGFKGTICIQQWSDITAMAAPAAYVKRQSATPPPLQQANGAAISSVANFGSAIAGDPTGLSNGFTCGDGFCSASENVGCQNACTCAIDCADVPTPTLSANILLPSGVIDLNIKPTIQNPTGNVVILVTRTPANLPAFQPVNGVSYTPGQIIGNSTMVYVGSVPQNVSISPRPNDTITEAGTYTYRAYQGNQYPRYGQPAQTTITNSVTLTAYPDVNNSGQVVSDDGRINCLNRGDPSCSATYPVGSTVNLSMFTCPGFSFIQWSPGCDPTNQTSCSAQLTSDLVVAATAIQNNPKNNPPPCPIVN